MVRVSTEHADVSMGPSCGPYHAQAYAPTVTTQKLWLTRHGESKYNLLGIIGGDSDLTERGRRYAQKLPAVLEARVPQGQQLVVWTSTLKRTQQTAQHLSQPQLRWKALDEINAGICDGLTYEQIAERYPAEYEARKKDKLRYRYPGGESYEDVYGRVAPLACSLREGRGCVLVVAHQAVLRALYALLMGVPAEDIPHLDIPQHALIELTPMPDGSLREDRIPVDVGTELPPGAAAAAAAPVGGSASAAVPRALLACGSGVRRRAASALVRADVETEVGPAEEAGVLLEAR